MKTLGFYRGVFLISVFQKNVQIFKAWKIVKNSHENAQDLNSGLFDNQKSIDQFKGFPKNVLS